MSLAGIAAPGAGSKRAHALEGIMFQAASGFPTPRSSPTRIILENGIETTDYTDFTAEAWRHGPKANGFQRNDDQ